MKEKMSLKDVKDAIFYIYDLDDKRVLAVRSIEYTGERAYGYKGQGFRETTAGWEFTEKFISIWDLINYSKRYDYTKEWTTALALASREVE